MSAQLTTIKNFPGGGPTTPPNERTQKPKIVNDSQQPLEETRQVHP